jgi:predicted RNA binding protein YcfA (HicA-like mRNA interferase family)
VLGTGIGIHSQFRERRPTGFVACKDAQLAPPSLRGALATKQSMMQQARLDRFVARAPRDDDPAVSRRPVILARGKSVSGNDGIRPQVGGRAFSPDHSLLPDGQGLSRSHKRTRSGWLALYRRTGSHHHYKHATKPGKVTVPHPKRDLHPRTVRSIYRQAGLKEPR